MKKILLLTITVLILLSNDSCKKNPPDNQDEYSFKYDNKQYDLRNGLIYSYKKTNGKYYYISVSANSPCSVGIVPYGDSTYGVCQGDFVKLNLVGDSMGVMPNNCEIIFDTNSYVILGFSETLNTFTLKDYIKSGSMHFASYSGKNLPGSFRFSGETSNGKILTIYSPTCFVSGE